LKLGSRAKECAMSLEAICGLKETNVMLANQVQSLEELIKFVRKKNAAALSEMKDLKSKVDVGQKVEKVVVKVLGLKDRLGSLTKCLTDVKNPWVNRLVTEVRLSQMETSFTSTTSIDISSPVANQVESLITVVDKMVSLVRKLEVVICDGLIAVLKNDFDLKELGDKGNTLRIVRFDKDINNQDFARVPKPDNRDTFLE
jgi:hypothetical protein